jgi:hypothetical protein
MVNEKSHKEIDFKRHTSGSAKTPLEESEHASTQEDRGSGATGTVGRHVVDVLKAEGHDVVGLSRSLGVDAVTGDGLAEALEGRRPEAAVRAWLVPDAFLLQQSCQSRTAPPETLAMAAVIPAARSDARKVAVSATRVFCITDAPPVRRRVCSFGTLLTV